MGARDLIDFQVDWFQSPHPQMVDKLRRGIENEPVFWGEGVRGESLS
jgi:hypothetical protein